LILQQSSSSINIKTESGVAGFLIALHTVDAHTEPAHSSSRRKM
jgi:hypothetical protein